MGRPKKAVVVLASIEDCTRVMGELRDALIDVDLLEADRHLAVATASAKFEAGIDAAKDTAAKSEASLQAYYYAHRAEIEKDGVKHLKLVNGVIGRRKNPDKLMPRLKGITWAAIAIAVKETLGMEYFHPAPERQLDREKLKKLEAEQLARVDLKLEADEKFYAEPAGLEVVA